MVVACPKVKAQPPNAQNGTDGAQIKPAGAVHVHQTVWPNAQLQSPLLYMVAWFSEDTTSISGCRKSGQKCPKMCLRSIQPLSKCMGCCISSSTAVAREVAAILGRIRRAPASEARG